MVSGFVMMLSVQVFVMAVFTDISNGRGVVSCDWFALSVRLAAPRDGSPLVAPSGWSCVLMSPTAVWSERWFVLDADGNKVATFLCSPRSPKIPPCSAILEVANRWLYYDDFHDILDKLSGMLPFCYGGLSRVDLCCDFEMDSRLYDTYCALVRGDAYVKALREGSVWWQMIACEVDKGESGLLRVPHCITFGGKESTFKWKVYYKWLELHQAAPEAKKPYIVQMWKDMGFQERYVWRIEVSVSSTNKLSDLGLKRIPALSWFDDRVRLFSDIYTDKFVVRENQGHIDKRNDRILPFLEVDGCKSVRHALPKSNRDDSDPERRMTVKLWNELQQSDVCANRRLWSMVRDSLMELLERPTNVWVLQRQLGVSIDDIATALAE